MSYNFFKVGKKDAAGPTLEIPPDTVTPRGRRAMEARPEVNVSSELGTELSWVDDEEELEVDDDATRCLDLCVCNCCNCNARGAEKPHDIGSRSANERMVKADLMVRERCRKEMRAIWKLLHHATAHSFFYVQRILLSLRPCHRHNIFSS